ncbi:MAG TPA: response regulator [Patescibacteria group bacterium]|nr:response regulator [Patescibacteria group bacterium]
MADKQIKILLVEDDSFLLSMYSTKFELENFDVTIAEDGEKGWKLAQKEDPDVILLDIKLPKMDGFEVLKKIKGNKETSNIPVILLTNLSQKEDRDKGLDLGADDYLVKAHFMPSEVVGKIKKLLQGGSEDKE